MLCCLQVNTTDTSKDNAHTFMAANRVLYSLQSKASQGHFTLLRALGSGIVLNSTFHGILFVNFICADAKPLHIDTHMR